MEYPSTVIIPLVLAVILCASVPWAVVAGANVQANKARVDARETAHDVASRFESQLKAAYEPVKFLGVLAEVMPHWSNLSTAFPYAAAKLMGGVPAGAIRSFQILPFGLIRDVYPRTEQNLEGIGFDLFSFEVR